MKVNLPLSRGLTVCSYLYNKHRGFICTYKLVAINEGQMPRPAKPEEREREREKEERERDRDREREKEVERQDKGTSGVPKEGPSHKTAPPSKEKYNLCKPISELDLSNSPKCTPSYRLLPKNVLYFQFGFNLETSLLG